jgi:FlaA1/EpsC-like NDP-sugar epimerase
VIWGANSTGKRITPADLLGVKPEQVYGEEARLLIEGQTVLVTGAGGSIGGEIVQQLMLLGAERIVCVDRDEYALYSSQIERTGSALMSESNIYLGDIQNYNEISSIIGETCPSIVFHAAAYKHVPTLEQMPGSAILTNIMGTENIMRASAEQGVRRVVNISTDKAANPVSVLGMSKRAAEMVAKCYANRRTQIASVRFGNVLGSRGSFVETMARQIIAGNPVTITDPEMTRYFMTIPQAAGLVIEAAVLANGGRTYVLNMGSPVRIVDLVQRYVELSGLPCPEIKITGQRPAEKLHEELYDPTEFRRRTKHPEISMVQVSYGGEEFLNELHQLYAMVRSGIAAAELRNKLESAIQAPATTTVGV